MHVASAHALQASGIGKHLAGRWILDNVSIHLERGEVVVLLGPNGAGKSTLLRIIMGLLAPNTGSVLLDGEDISRWPTYRRARAGLGYLPQEPSAFLGLSARQNLEAVLELRGRVRAEAGPLLEAMGLAARSEQRAGTLSGGERRRLEIARLLALRPRWLLLDEPLRGLDKVACEALTDKITALVGDGSTVLITDHPVDGDGALAGALTLAPSLCRRKYVLADGRLVAGDTADDHLAYLGKQASLGSKVRRLPTWAEPCQDLVSMPPGGGN